MGTWAIWTQFILPALGGGAAFVAAIGGFLYWLMKKAIDDRFSKGLEDYRYRHSIKLHNERLRLDLYDRRFEIFESIFPFYEAMIAWEGTPEQKQAQKRFFQAWHKSKFLFKKDSGITELLDSLNKDGIRVIGFKENKDNLKTDHESFNKEFKIVTDIQVHVFVDGLAKLERAMHPYLGFDKAHERSE